MTYYTDHDDVTLKLTPLYIHLISGSFIFESRIYFQKQGYVKFSGIFKVRYFLDWYDNSKLRFKYIFSYCHHLASGVRLNFKKKSSPLKPLDQFKPNLAWIILKGNLQGRWILLCWSCLPRVRFLFLLTVFELLPKNCNFTPMFYV
jgi:hypothetical protein